MSGILSTTLSRLNSDSYCEIGEYRDQHFKVGAGRALHLLRGTLASSLAEGRKEEHSARAQRHPRPFAG